MESNLLDFLKDRELLETVLVEEWWDFLKNSEVLEILLVLNLWESWIPILMEILFED